MVRSSPQGHPVFLNPKYSRFRTSADLECFSKMSETHYVGFEFETKLMFYFVSSASDKTFIS